MLGTPLFEERQGMYGWVCALIFGPLLIVAFAVLTAAPADEAREALPALLIGPAVVLLIVLLFGRMTTQLYSDQLAVGFGYLPLIRFRFRREEIRWAQAREYRPIREYGGWGIRGIGRKRALNMKGKHGVEIGVHRGGSAFESRIMIGSGRSAELENALRGLGIGPRPA